ncbi:hypothetical protein D1007_57333 [Hordeum vulgare]|nr:hypothetical protein D1007_57333 [Hordeum vulgare]
MDSGRIGGARMVDADGPWYDGLIDVFDREHSAPAIKNRKVSVYTGNSHVRYKCYVNEMDTLSVEQVFLRPYVNDLQFDLNEMCTRDNLLWRARCPMICFYALEWHFLDRVAWQFGKRQGIPIESKETITKLHRFSRRNNEDISYWVNKHHRWLEMWNQRHTLLESENRTHNGLAYEKYLVWYEQRYRLKLKPGWTQEEWSELVSKDPSAAEGQRFAYVRERCQCSTELSPLGGGLSERTLRTMMEFRTRFHKMADMVSCHIVKSVDVFTAGTSRSSRARRHHLCNDDTEEDVQAEEQTQEEQAQEHEYDIDAPQSSHLSHPT